MRVASGIFWLTTFLWSVAFARAEECDRFDLTVSTTPVAAQTATGLRQEAAWEERALSLHPETVVVGDSIAARWPPALAKEAFGADVVMFGVEGDRTQNALWRLGAEAFAGWRPARVVLLLGTNNLGTVDKTCTILAGLSAMLTKIKDVWHPSEVWLLTILPRGRDLQFRQQDRQIVNDRLVDFVRQGAATRVIRLDDADLTILDFRPDALHPIMSGYEKITKTIIAATSSR